ncbi:hypothetical protein JCM10213_008921 [Rhodosporidiobolus nylandii]
MPPPSSSRTSPATHPSPLPSSSSSRSSSASPPLPASPRFPPGLTPVGALAVLPPTPGSGSSSSSGGGVGSGRGRRLGSANRQSSVQARRSAASLGLGAEFASMNELTSSSLSPSRGSTSGSASGSGGSAGSASPSPSSRAYSPPASRRSSLQFASPSLASAVPPSPGISTLGPPPGLGFPTASPTPSAAVPPSLPPLPEGAVATTSTPSTTRPPSRRPSLTHLASFLSGITHHTRVRSPGVHGGRGVSRSASRSQSRSGFRRYGSGGETDEGEGGGGGGGGFAWGSDVDEPEDGASAGGFSFFPPGSLSRAGSRRRRTTTTGSSLSRASSVRSGRSRASSFSAASTTASGAPHPLLHELVRENTTGGVSPSPSLAAAVLPSQLQQQQQQGAGPEVVAGTTGAAAAGSVQPETWEQTYEVYKPSLISTPRVQPRSPLDEEPFLDSAPSSPSFAPPSAPPIPRARRQGTYSSLARTSSALSSVTNDLSTIDVFDEGERVGVGVWLEGRGGWVRDCFAEPEMSDGVEGKGPGNGLDGPRQLEVERRLGEGTYAIVYLVREVLYDPDPTSDDDILSPIDPLGSFSFDDSPSSSSGRPRMHSWSSDYYQQPAGGAGGATQYGEYFALKCLCKKNLTDELIEVQRNEAFLHRALPKHENIVQMYGAYETDDWLFLVLEYAGGRDAFYWLLEAQEHGTEDLYSRAASPSGYGTFGGLGEGGTGYFSPAANTSPRRTSFPFSDDGDGDDPDESALSRTITADTPAHLLGGGSLSRTINTHNQDLLVGSVEETPPSPSLLSAAVGDALLSRKRLRLISRMFGQMCAAVQACHDVGISHRDIKPENFIVIDGKGDLRQRTEEEERRRRREGVVVKITDWGLGTMEEFCEDFDCGSKPYMAYECRNNLRPTYDPRQADVWSLGLVFLNLLYHRNPWADPSLEDPDFADYVEDPIGFLQNRFEGMSDEVAAFLAQRVFCDVLEIVDGKQRRRVSAGEFGQWASRLVVMMGGRAANPFSPAGDRVPDFSLYGQNRPQFANLESYNADYDFSPVTTMPISITGGVAQASPTPGAANLPNGQSLLSQHFAPSTLRTSTVLDEPELPTVPEITPPQPPPGIEATPFGSANKPSFISSPTALSEDGESLPSPTFPSPPPPPKLASPPSIYSPLPSAHASPEQRPFVRMPWSSPLPSPKPSPAASPAPTHAELPAPIASTLSPLASPASVHPATPASGISLLAARRPSLLDAQQESMVSNASLSTVMPDGSPPPPSGLGTSPSPPAPKAEQAENTAAAKEKPVESEEGSPDATTAKDADADAEAKKANKSKRRKRGARKEKRAAREQAKLASASGTSPPLSSSRGSGHLPTLEEDRGRERENVLDDLAAASQELARELSAARSNNSLKQPSRPRPVPSSRQHGTQSTSALPFSLSSTSNSAFPPLSAAAAAPPQKKQSSGVFGRLKTLVNEGNPDLEAFKRRVDERNASIGATSAPAKMQQGAGGPGAKVPKGKYDSPFSSRGSVGTASWGSAADGGDEAVRGRGVGAAAAEGKDHWSSASSRRDRLAGRRQGPGNGSDFAPSSTSTRGTSAFTAAGGDGSRNATPLSSFGSVSSDWRSGSHSRTRPTQELAPPLPLPLPSSPSKAKKAEGGAGRPKLKDAATDTSDLVPTMSSLSIVASLPTPSAASAPAATPTAKHSTPSTATASPRPLPPSLPSASPVLSPASVAASAPAGTPAGKGKLAKMLGNIGVFNRAQGGSPGAA